MSANNYLSIVKSEGKYKVFDMCMEGVQGFLIQDEPFDTLEDAIKAANLYQLENVVEYGLQISI